MKVAKKSDPPTTQGITQALPETWVFSLGRSTSKLSISRGRSFPFWVTFHV